MRSAIRVMVVVTGVFGGQLVAGQTTPVVKKNDNDKVTGARFVDRVKFQDRLVQGKNSEEMQAGLAAFSPDTAVHLGGAAPAGFFPTQAADTKRGNDVDLLTLVVPADLPSPIDYFDLPLLNDATSGGEFNKSVPEDSQGSQVQDHVFSLPLGEGNYHCTGWCEYDLVKDSRCDYGCDCAFGSDGVNVSCSPWSLGGWLSMGIYDNDQGRDGSLGNSPLVFNNVAEEYQLQQVWMYVKREVKNGGCGWAWGLRADLMFGSDGLKTQAYGDGSWDASWDTSSQYGFALPRFYGELAYNDWRVKIGHFYTIIGYEVVQAPNNFFSSHAYTFGYNQPLTHTGILAEKPLNDLVTLYGGYTLGWDTGFDNRNDGSTFLGGIGMHFTNELDAFYATSFGDPGDNPAGNSATYTHSLIVDWSLNDRLDYVFQNDFQTRSSTIAGGKTYGLSQYLIYALTNKLSTGMRYEWFRDSRSERGVAGASEHFHALTMGLNFKLTNNLWIKPEMRYDWTDRDDTFVGAAFDDGTEANLFYWGSQLLYTF